jgi:hypothetical protein
VVRSMEEERIATEGWDADKESRLVDGARQSIEGRPGPNRLGTGTVACGRKGKQRGRQASEKGSTMPWEKIAGQGPAKATRRGEENKHRGKRTTTDRQTSGNGAREGDSDRKGSLQGEGPREPIVREPETQRKTDTRRGRTERTRTISTRGAETDRRHGGGHSINGRRKKCLWVYQK